MLGPLAAAFAHAIDNCQGSRKARLASALLGWLLINVRSRYAEGRLQPCSFYSQCRIYAQQAACAEATLGLEILCL
jgi:hypothetical protein